MTLPYDYYPTVLECIEKISQGRTKTDVCDEYRITIASFDKYVNSSPELQALLAEAEARGYDSMADMLLKIDRMGPYAQSDSKMAKVISDNIKWLLSKRKQKTYGDKVEVTHNLTADKAITDALNAGRQRALQGAGLSGTVVDAVFEEVEDDIMASLLQ